MSFMDDPASLSYSLQSSTNFLSFKHFGYFKPSITYGAFRIIHADEEFYGKEITVYLIDRNAK